MPIFHIETCLWPVLANQNKCRTQPPTYLGFHLASVQMQTILEGAYGYTTPSMVVLFKPIQFTIIQEVRRQECAIETAICQGLQDRKLGATMPF